MSKIEIGRYSELLRRSLGMKGQEIVSGDLSPEISPVLELESAADQEWDFLKAVKQCSCAERVQANAGGGGHARLRNPPDSGVLLVVSQLIMRLAIVADVAVNFQQSTADLLNTGLTTARDGRWNQSTLSQSAARFSFTAASGAVPTAAGTVFRSAILANTTLILGLQLILPPGFAVEFGCLNPSIQVDLGADWKERALPRLEL